MSSISIKWSLQACSQYTSPFFNRNQRILYRPMSRISVKWSLQAFSQYNSPFYPESALIQAILYPKARYHFCQMISISFFPIQNTYFKKIKGFYVIHWAAFLSHDHYGPIFDTLHHFASNIRGFYILTLFSIFIKGYWQYYFHYTSPFVT